MKPAEYFDAAKARLNIESDYEMCKRFGIPDKGIPAMRNGTRRVPLDTAYKLAITLEMDPAQLVADLEAQREKNPQRKDIWTSFISRAATVLMVLVYTLALNFSATYENAENSLGGNRQRLHHA